MWHRVQMAHEAAASSAAPQGCLLFHLPVPIVLYVESTTLPALQMWGGPLADMVLYKNTWSSTYLKPGWGISTSQMLLKCESGW